MFDGESVVSTKHEVQAQLLINFCEDDKVCMRMRVHVFVAGCHATPTSISCT